MRHRLAALISRAQRDLAQAAEELASSSDLSGVSNEEFEDDLYEARARVLALEARVDAIEERSKE